MKLFIIWNKLSFNNSVPKKNRERERERERERMRWGVKTDIKNERDKE